jgi:hypothetical protein
MQSSESLGRNRALNGRASITSMRTSSSKKHLVPMSSARDLRSKSSKRNITPSDSVWERSAVSRTTSPRPMKTSDTGRLDRSSVQAQEGRVEPVYGSRQTQVVSEECRGQVSTITRQFCISTRLTSRRVIPIHGDIAPYQRQGLCHGVLKKPKSRLRCLLVP